MPRGYKRKWRAGERTYCIGKCSQLIYSTDWCCLYFWRTIARSCDSFTGPLKNGDLASRMAVGADPAGHYLNLKLCRQDLRRPSVGEGAARVECDVRVRHLLHLPLPPVRSVMHRD